MGYDSEKRWADFKLGLLTFTAMTLLITGISFAGGNKGIFLHETTNITVLLPDIGGLKTGSAVSMSGMTIGKVVKIGFTSDVNSQQIEVQCEIQSAVRPRIKNNSVPIVRTQGMMGDRYLDIATAATSEESPSLPEGASLTGSQTSDFDATLREATATLTETKKLLAAVNEKQGSAGQLVYDQRLYENLTNTTKALNELIEDFKKKPSKYINLSIF